MPAASPGGLEVWKALAAASIGPYLVPEAVEEQASSK
jgi:hypothetical protein